MLALAGAGLLTLPTVTQAEEKPSSVMTALASTTLSGYVDTSMSWRPGTSSRNAAIPGRAFDGPAAKQDGFNLDVVSLTLSKPVSEGDWGAGYVAQIWAGPDAVGFNTAFPNGAGEPGTAGSVKHGASPRIRVADLRNNPRLNKKVLIVITDGQDNMSRETLQDAMRKLQSNKGATVYAIGLTDEGMTRSGRQALQDLATSTGGVAFFPQNADEVNEISRSVARDIRTQYTIAYNPGPNIGKGYQTIRAEARLPGHTHLTVRTRSGYYPGETMR